VFILLFLFLKKKSNRFRPRRIYTGHQKKRKSQNTKRTSKKAKKMMVRKKKVVEKPEPMIVVKKLVGKQMAQVVRGETDPRVIRMSTFYFILFIKLFLHTHTHTLHTVKIVCKDFVTKVCSEVFENGNSLVVGPRPNPKNEKLAEDIKILEEQLDSYTSEMKSWDELKARIDLMKSQMCVEEEQEEKSEILSETKTTENIDFDTEFLNKAQMALMKVDDLQRTLCKAEKAASDATVTKVRLAKSFDTQMRSALVLNNKTQTPRKLIRGMLR